MKTLDIINAVRPTERQLRWQELEFTAFLHYGINTFTGREWGDGREDPQLYDPRDLDTDQWCEVLLSAGIKACIITAKHHDGFCLFESAHTGYGVMASGKPADVVAELARSCRKYGLKLGVYLSPWDRNSPVYGSGAAYDDYFCAQLEEITTKYGELYSLWFDGACGEGPKKQVYDWARYYAVIRKNQPNAVIAVCGPDVRWIGNEAGFTRPSEWSVVPARLAESESVARRSQTADNSAFRELPISSEDVDLGSLERLTKEIEAGGELIWYPAEVDVSIRPGWFYHKHEDEKVRSVENLLEIYEKSVGGNAVLLLNIPPDTAGRISEPDAKRLAELGERIREIYGKDLFIDCEVEKRAAGKIIITPEKPLTLTHLVLSEDISQGQRVEKFEVFADEAKIYTGTTIGYKKICRFEAVSARCFTVCINETRAEPIIKQISGHSDPVEVSDGLLLGN